MMMTVLYALLALVGLWIGTKWVMNGAFAVAKKFKLSHTFVGLAILAVCTDLPEIFVSINASLLQLKGQESSGIITGNAIGSCMSQITIILGVAGLFIDLKMVKKIAWRDGSFLLSSIILLAICALDGEITRAEGIIMFCFYLTYYVILLKTQQIENNQNETTITYSVPAILFFFAFGFPLLIFSSKVLIDNALILVDQWGLPQSFIGVLLIGVGTSLPELAVSLAAALRKSYGMSIGNIIGSNIFDTLVPISLGSVISKVQFAEDLLHFDIVFLFSVSLAVIIFLFTKRGISKLESIFLLLLYISYILVKFLFFRS